MPPPPPARSLETGTSASPPPRFRAGVRWLNIERPREPEREWLEKEFGFHPLAIEDVASRNQRPKLDAYDDYLFIVLHFPVFDKAQDRLLTAELDLFVGPAGSNPNPLGPPGPWVRDGLLPALLGL